MNQELQKELLSIVKDGHQGVVSGLELLKQKAPELVSQILAYEFYINLVNVIVFGTLFSLSTLSLIYGIHQENKIKWEKANPFFIFGLIGFAIFGLTLLANNAIANLIQIKTAPALYVIDYISHIVKNS